MQKVPTARYDHRGKSSGGNIIHQKPRASTRTQKQPGERLVEKRADLLRKNEQNQPPSNRGGLPNRVDGGKNLHNQTTNLLRRVKAGGKPP